MAVFTYTDLSYDKRPLTDDIALRVISAELPDTDEKLSEFGKLAKPYKDGEAASQQDACPVTGIPGLRDYVGFLKKTYDGFRIRRLQLSGVAAVKGSAGDISPDTAAYLIAAGSTAVIAGGYENGADEVLLENGILPLVSARELPVGTFILIKGIRSGISGGRTEAYAVTPDSLTPLEISLGSYPAGKLDKILE